MVALASATIVATTMNPVNLRPACYTRRARQEELLATVTTVTGGVDADALGITLTHEHVFVDLGDWAGLNGKLDDPELARRELSRFKDAGGVSVVDVTTRGIRIRDHQHLLPEKHPVMLRKAAQETGLNIVMGTGWYVDWTHEERLSRMTTDEIADELIRDLTEGVDGTDVSAGILGEIGVGLTWVSPGEERVLRAVARAHLQTGVSILTHTGGPLVGLKQLAILSEEGVAPSRVIIGHCHSHPDHDYHAELARRGAFVSFDRLGRPDPTEHALHVRLIGQMIEAGLTEHLLFSHDVCLREDYVAYGGKGYEFVPRGLREDPVLHLTEGQFHQITVDNPRRALTGDE